MALNKKHTTVPILRPVEFDDYIFANWKAPVSAFYSKFHIERIENYKKHLKLPLPPHRRSVYFFIYLIKGKVIRSKGLSSYEIGSKTFFFLPADQITSLEYVSKNAEGYYCHFLPEIFSALKLKDFKQFSFFDFTGEPILKIKDDYRIIQLLKILEIENKKNESYRFELISIYLFALLTEVRLQQPLQGAIKQNASTQLTQRFKTALIEHLANKKNIQEFASFLTVSPNHLNKCVRAVVGKSAHDLLDEMRILEAKVLLKQSDLTIGEIAYRIGRFEPSDFARFFKTKAGITPYQFRQT